MKKHRLSHEQDLCAGKHLSRFDGCDVEREKQSEGRELLQQDEVHICYDNLTCEELEILQLMRETGKTTEVISLLTRSEQPYVVLETPGVITQ